MAIKGLLEEDHGEMEVIVEEHHVDLSSAKMILGKILVLGAPFQQMVNNSLTSVPETILTINL